MLRQAVISSRRQHSILQTVWRQVNRFSLRSEGVSSLPATSRRFHALSACCVFDRESLLDPSVDPFDQQVRWKRRDGNKAFMKERGPTKKQRKKYNRKLKAMQEAQDRHGKPGYKAGPRREWAQQMKEELLNSGKDNELDTLPEYEMSDALLDDLMGNTQFVSSQPTPRPKYFGRQYEKYRQRVLDQMEQYRSKLELLKEKSSSQTGFEVIEVAASDMPSDRAISLALRSYRDKFGTRSKPVGIAKALGFLLQELGVPIAALDEQSYTTLLTCCRTSKEARRILQLMNQEQHPISAYSWSILVDIHAKLGDFEGCAQVMQEMLQAGVPPTLAAYTSFLAACYKVCQDGRVAHKVRAKAAKMGWEKWMEMRVVGVEPDVMAYGSMLRLCAAQGHPERALNVLEEMQQMSVKPTTLCFSSALRAVAKSHSIAVRFERGASKRNRRREFLTQHHGKMARSIVIMAENAEVNQDDGFISALIMCAAAAGDAATAKAIYVASQIRSLDQFRTIGPDSHLTQLRGESTPELSDHSNTDLLPSNIGSDVSLKHSSSANQISTLNWKMEHIPSFEEREYGKDSRILSAIIHACAHAINQNSIGTMWQGRENGGYLCENSLRLLASQKVPRYEDRSIPGQSRTDDLTWEGEHKDEDYRGSKRSKRNFKGVFVDENAADTLDELDETFARIFEDDEGRLKDEFRKTTPEDIWQRKYGSEEETSALTGDKSFPFSDGDGEGNSPEDERRQASFPAETKHEEMYFDKDTMRWVTRLKDISKVDKANTVKVDNPIQPEILTESKVKEDIYFDRETMRWKTREKVQENDILRANTQVLPDRTTFESKMLETTESSSKLDDTEFGRFFEELRAEIAESDDDLDNVSEEEARELFLLMKDEYAEVMGMEMDQLLDLSNPDFDELNIPAVSSSMPSVEDKDRNAVTPIVATEECQLSNDLNKSNEMAKNYVEPVAVVVSETGALQGGVEGGPEAEFTKHLMRETSRNMIETATIPGEWVSEASVEAPNLEDVPSAAESLGVEILDGVFTESTAIEESVEGDEHSRELAELRQLLPAFSDSRLRRIHDAFRRSLAEPSLLELVPLVRERMPDYVTSTWLKQMSAMTARYVIRNASLNQLVDIHMVNSVLELETMSGSLQRAIEFYETEFERHHLTPNEYSNRLLLQMFLNNNRFSRALAFKDSLRSEGALPDILSYGSLIDYCGRHGKVGSGIIILKECLAVHGASPGEAFVSSLRTQCNKVGLKDELVAMIGNDPVEWLKHGEAELKREYSKKGRRDVLLARNRLVHI